MSGRRAPGRAVALGLVLASALAACERGAQAPGGPGADGPRAPVVEVMELAPRALSDTVALLGQLEAEESVFVRPEIQGILRSVGFREGDAVEEGEVLFVLRDEEQVARLHEAEADLALATDTWERTRKLVKRQVESVVQLERNRAQLAAARARVELAQVELARTRIRAPFDGVTGARLVSPGASVDHETDLVQLQAIASLELAFSLPEQALPLARVGIPFELTVAPYPDERFPGEIVFVAPGLNPRNRRLLVKGRVPNPDGRLRPGLFAKVDTRIAQREQALVVPEDAVVFEPQGPVVWRVGEGNAVERVAVELGIREPGRVEIRTGLAPGDRVVVAGTNKLSPGTVVEPKPAPPLASGPDPGEAPDGGSG